MKLLFDENLSHTLARTLANLYPDSHHVRDVGLRALPDQDVWNYAREQGFAIVSKDTDFRERSFVEGAPPRVIWLGNAGTSDIARLLQRDSPRVEAFGDQDDDISADSFARRQRRITV